MAVALIGLDWGTTSLRAYRLDEAGDVVERRQARAGILSVRDGDFDGALTSVVGDWLQGVSGLPIIASGMVGSRQGWVEAPYVACPAGLRAVASRMLQCSTAAGQVVHIVPGLDIRAADGVPDVMRGEETQVLGALDRADANAILVLPGSHSKWVSVRAGRIEWFSTFLTGELFAVLVEHSILGRLMEGRRHDEQAFARGVAYGGSAHGRSAGTLRRLFSARTLALSGELEASFIHAYLSGLLIGTEIAEARAVLGDRHELRSVGVIGDSTLVTRYVDALALGGIQAVRLPVDAAARGLHRIAQAAGLL